MSKDEYIIAGAIGLSFSLIMSISSFYCLYLFLRWRKINLKHPSRKKRLLFHILILLTGLLDLPLWIGFIITCDYKRGTFAVHKLQSTCLFSAFSLTISDWIKVLTELDYDRRSFVFLIRNEFLLIINIIFAAMSIADFIICLESKSMDSFTSSPFYIISYWFQILVAFVISSAMMSSGLRLQARLIGVSRGLNVNSPSVFRKALGKLTSVMIICLFCISSQIIFLLLNYFGGHSGSADDLWIPLCLWLLVVSWLPTYGWGFSLLFLSRQQTKLNVYNHHYQEERVVENDNYFQFFDGDLESDDEFYKDSKDSKDNLLINNLLQDPNHYSDKYYDNIQDKEKYKQIKNNLLKENLTYNILNNNQNNNNNNDDDDDNDNNNDDDNDDDDDDDGDDYSLYTASTNSLESYSFSTNSKFSNSMNNSLLQAASLSNRVPTKLSPSIRKFHSVDAAEQKKRKEKKNYKNNIISIEENVNINNNNINNNNIDNNDFDPDRPSSI